MQLFNSLTRTKEPFHSLQDKKVTVYVCGITPYDTTHLGHAFLYVFFDAAIRYLQSIGYHVDYTQNVTDIDDDILKRAKKEGRDWKELGESWTQRFLTDLKAFNVSMPTYYVKATDSIPQIIEMVKKLIEKGHAYEVEGTVFFSVPTFADYGKLSKYSRQEMIELSRERGADPEDPRKKDPLDFILWQKSLPDEPFWESPWGKGRPGWHIECSAMIRQYLGEQIDLHGGGFDLIYPHHESEIAQSESYTGKKPFVGYWMHAAMLMYEGEKMSKSLGNLVLVADLLKTYSPNAIRYLLLSHHYREQWEYKEDEMQRAEKQIAQLKNALTVLSQGSEKLSAHKYQEEFATLMEDDFQIPVVLTLLQNVATIITEHKDENDISELQKFVRNTMQVLGFIIE